MHIVVPIRLVPDLVEELTIDGSGSALDTTWLRLIINELDNHAIEQAILLKERSGGVVTVVAPDAEGVDEVLFTAAAQGADRIVKLTGGFEAGANSHALARAYTNVMKELQPELILTGVQAHNDLDGSVGPLLAGYMGIPYVGYVSGVSLVDGQSIIRKEYPGGLMAEMEVALPAVLGIQAADHPPRYVPISKVRQAMKTVKLENMPVDVLDPSHGPTVSRMYQPETTDQATMLAGDANEVANQLVEILTRQGLL